MYFFFCLYFFSYIYIYISIIFIPKWNGGLQLSFNLAPVHLTNPYLHSILSPLLFSVGNYIQTCMNIDFLVYILNHIRVDQSIRMPLLVVVVVWGCVCVCVCVFLCELKMHTKRCTVKRVQKLKAELNKLES